MLKKGRLISIFLILSSLRMIACQCVPLKLIDEIISSKNIFIGKIINVNKNIYEIEILTIYKGLLYIENTYKIKQPNDSCHKNRFDTNESYIFFESPNDNGFHQCSRTKRLSESSVLKTLEKIYPNRKINIDNKDMIEKLIYNHIYLLRLFDGKTIDTKNKQVLYFDGKSILKEPKKDLDNHWLGINYYQLFKDINIDNIQYNYVIYYIISHEEFILNEEKKTKLRKKFLRKKADNKM